MDKANPVSTPGVDTDNATPGQVEESSEQTRYRAISARANYLAIDRPDVQYVVKEICRSMSAPCTEDWNKLKRLARYLIGRPRLVQQFIYQDEYEAKQLTTYTDSNWAGCKKTRKSTSAASIMIGKHCIKTYSKTQATVALSSAEAELYAVVRGTQETLGILSIINVYGRNAKSVVRCDASAAIAIVRRSGLGRTKHVSVQWLWVQQIAKQEAIKYDKVGGWDNPADAMTKHLPKTSLDKHIAFMNYVFMAGRATSAPKVAADDGTAVNTTVRS